MKKRLRSLVLSSALLASLPLSALADFSIYSPKTGIADGWKSSAWNGPVTDEVAGAAKDTTVLQIGLKPDSKPYAGVVLTATPGNEIALTEKLRKSGKIHLRLKPGRTADGAAATDSQALQIGVSFLTKDGQTVHGRFSTQVTVSPTVTAEGQAVIITMATALEGVKSPELLASISSVRFQFIDTPLVGFSVVDCTIKSE